MVRWNDLEAQRSPERPQDDHAESAASSSSASTDDSPSNEKPTDPETPPEEHDEHTIAVLESIESAANALKKKLHLTGIKATGISRIFNPTNVRVRVRWNDDDDRRRSSDPHSDGPSEKLEMSKEAAILWRSRDNRKGRNSIAVPPSSLDEETGLSAWLPRFSFNVPEIGKNIWLMCSTFPYWDMAFWSGWAYTWGSVLFVIDGAWSFGPTAFPSTEWEGESQYAVGLAFFFGALFYQLGATMAYFEAVNDGSFHGSAMRRLLEGNEDEQKRMLDQKIHSFFGHVVPHRKKDKQREHAEALANAVDPEAGWNTLDRKERPGSLYPPSKEPAPRRGGVDMGEAEDGDPSEYTTWRWYPSWHMLKTHHAYEIGYLACAIQLFGATLYGITGVVALPGILESLEVWEENAAYWVPQIVASCCFLSAGLLFTLETQEKWYKPELTVIGWWIGLFATIGSIGFLLCAVFGPSSAVDVYWAEYQSLLSSMWGSGAYLISGLLQWYEAVNKRPVLELFNEPGELKSSQIHPI